MRPQTKNKKKEIDVGSGTSSWKFEKRKDEEDEARCLIEEMQGNCDAAQNGSYEAEQKLYKILWEYIESLDKEQGRPEIVMTNSGSSCWSEAARTRRFWAQDEDEDQ